MKGKKRKSKKSIRVLKWTLGVFLALFVLAGLTSKDASKTEQSTLLEVDQNEGENSEPITIQMVSNPDYGVTNDNPTTQETFTFQSDLNTTLEIHFIDVGQGDATLIKCDGHYMLIDAGDNSKGTTVWMYLKKQGVERLDAVIWTHPDADHIGGADVITSKFDIETIYMTNVSSDTKTYNELIDSMNYKGYKNTVPQAGSSFMLGPATVTFLGPVNSYEDKNDSSIACMVQYGDRSFLFTGDAEENAEADMLRANLKLSADVYKAGHHGSKTASSEAFLESVKPTYVVISCGVDNSYGHPHAEVMNNFCTRGIQVFRTDEQGSLVATTNGTEITWNAAPSETWKAGEPTGSSQKEVSNNTSNFEVGSAPEGAVYIGNKNGQKLHRATCNPLPLEKNQVLFNSLEEASAAGFTRENQCKKCTPYN